MVAVTSLVRGMSAPLMWSVRAYVPSVTHEETMPLSEIGRVLIEGDRNMRFDMNNGRCLRMKSNNGGGIEYSCLVAHG